MSSTDLNENNNLSIKSQENIESFFTLNNSIEFDYNIKIIEKPIFESKILLDFKTESNKVLYYAKIYKDISDKKGEEELMKDLKNNRIKYDLNEISKKLICNIHDSKYNKYCTKCRKNLCEKCLDEYGHNDQEDFIELKFEKDFNILLNNFLKKTIKEDNIIYIFHYITMALCNAFQSCPHIENYMSLKNAIKLILDIDQLFYYTKDDSKNEDLNRELLKEKMMILEINLENKFNKKIVYCNCCNYCNSSVQFKFFSENRIKKFCESEEKSFGIDDCQQYIKTKTDILKDDLQNDYEQQQIDFKDLYCILHKKKKFIAYCTDCRKNRCEDCIVEFNEKTHNMINFKPPSFTIEKFIKYGYKFCRFINAILNTIKEYPNIYSYKSLESAEKLLTGKYNNLNQINNDEDYIIVKNFSLLSKRKHKKNKDYYKNIKSIVLEAQNIRSLNYFTKLENLSNLRYLKLRENHISSIEWLLKCNFLNNLIVLDLNNNSIGDNNIKYFKKLYLREKLLNLEQLYLFENRLESFTLFDFIQYLSETQNFVFRTKSF